MTKGKIQDKLKTIELTKAMKRRVSSRKMNREPQIAENGSLETAEDGLGASQLRV